MVKWNSLPRRRRAWRPGGEARGEVSCPISSGRGAAEGRRAGLHRTREPNSLAINHCPTRRPKGRSGARAPGRRRVVAVGPRVLGAAGVAEPLPHQKEVVKLVPRLCSGAKGVRASARSGAARDQRRGGAVSGAASGAATRGSNAASGRQRRRSPGASPPAAGVKAPLSHQLALVRQLLRAPGSSQLRGTRGKLHPPRPGQQRPSCTRAGAGKTRRAWAPAAARRTPSIPISNIRRGRAIVAPSIARSQAP
jgi:hypothetical protein